MTKTVFSAFDLGLGGGAPVRLGAPANRRPVTGTAVLNFAEGPGEAGGGAGGAGGAAAERGACGTTMAWWHDGQLICVPE